MAGGHDYKFADLTLHAPKRWHTVTGKGMCAVMWLWIFYRAKNDGAALLGLRHPWDDHGHASHGGHGHGHGKGNVSRKSQVHEGTSAGIPARSRDDSKLRDKLDYRSKSDQAMDLLKQTKKIEEHPKVLSLIQEDH